MESSTQESAWMGERGSCMQLQREQFRPLPRNREYTERMARKPLTYWQDAWRRLKLNKGAMLGLFILATLLFMAIIGPYLTPYDYQEQSFTKTNQGASMEHWFGTDDLGRDLWTRVWWGTRVSLLIGVVAALLDLVIGVIYGSIAGYIGNRTDNIMMRIIEILMGIPNLILIILFIIFLGPGISTIILSMVITGWMGMARLVRGQVFQLKEQEYVLAARALGANTQRIMLKHLIPNAMGPIIVSITFTIPTAIFFEAFLGFIGLGLRPPFASLGVLILDGYKIMTVYPYQFLIPATTISLIMFSFNLVGDGLRDALDPKFRR
jgi:oligopeptide transport system permease protein